MQNAGKMLVALILCFILVGCGSGDSEKSFASFQAALNSELSKADLRIYWPVELRLDDDETLTKLQLLDENLYCLTSTNRLIAINASTGIEKWSYRVAPGEDTVYRPSHVNKVVLSEKPLGAPEIMGVKPARMGKQFNAVLINTISYVVVLNRDTGEVRSKIPFKFSASNSGASDGRYFFVGSFGGQYHAIALSEAIVAWSFSTGSMISAPIRYFNKHIFVASEDHKLYCTQVGVRGKEIWSRKFDGAATAAFYVDTQCFVPCRDNRLYAFDALSGVSQWKSFICDGPLTSGVQVGKEKIYQYSDNDGLYAIDSSSGKKQWHIPSRTSLRVVAVADGKVYVRTTGGMILVVDDDSGKISQKVAIKGISLIAGNVRTPAIYIATRDGKVLCLQLRQAGHLTMDMVTK